MTHIKQKIDRYSSFFVIEYTHTYSLNNREELQRLSLSPEKSCECEMKFKSNRLYIQHTTITEKRLKIFLFCQFIIFLLVNDDDYLQQQQDDE